MPAPLPRESRITGLLEKLGALLDCIDESQWEMLVRRRNWVENSTQKLADAQTDAQHVELYQEIRYALKGGMGSLVDVYVYPGADCEFSSCRTDIRVPAVSIALATIGLNASNHGGAAVWIPVDFDFSTFIDYSYHLF